LKNNFRRKFESIREIAKRRFRQNKTTTETTTTATATTTTERQKERKCQTRFLRIVYFDKLILA
jgi:hypothetical protein